ncbi:MAG: DnaJ domain-containing protein [Oscillospiraceae bacterium]
MTDPYKVLGVSPNAKDDEIKDAYRKLAKKYHPDQYSGSPLADLADEKMKEINEAYDEVVAQRKNKTTGGYAGSAGGYYGYNNAASSGFADVRNFINSGRIADAEQILNGVPTEKRNAEWHFLKGSVLFRRGWLEEAKEHFSQACQMDPGNMEYRAAMNQSMNQRSGAYGGFNPNANNGNVGGCNSCDMCSSLMCADCCCECMGGDLIRCC